MTNEYIFFSRELCDRFVAFVAGHGIAGSVRPDEIDGFVVALPDALPDAADAAIEEEYDRLMDEQRAQIDAAEDDDARDLMGVSVTLPDGRPCVVRLPAEYARRLVAQFSIEEIRELVSHIATSVAAPSTTPLCRAA